MALSSQQVTDALERARQKLMTVREKRPRPHLDNKMITAWNGSFANWNMHFTAV